MLSISEHKELKKRNHANLELLYVLKEKVTNKRITLATIEERTELLTGLNGAILCLQKYRDAHDEIFGQQIKRLDHWDVLNEKLNSDPMFKELWDQILILLRLTED